MSEELEIEGAKEGAPPPGANQELDELKTKLKDLEDKTATLEREKGGIYADLKREQERRRQMESEFEERRRAVEDAEDRDPFGNVGDEDFITGKQLKDFQKITSKKERDRLIRDAKQRGAERVAIDEDRMRELCEVNTKKYPVAYDEAVQAFIELANGDPSLWSQYDSEKFRPGGKPAQLAYRIALREHPKYREAAEKRTRESLLEELEQKGEKPRKLTSGSGGGVKRLEDMTDEEISALSDEELDRYSRT